MAYYFVLIAATLLLIPGIVMAVLPFPGIIYMFAIAVIAALFDGFVHLSGFDIGVLTVVTVLVLLVDLFSGIIGAKAGGAHWSSIIWSLVGFIIGSIIIPVPILGSLAGMFLGVLVSEWYHTQDIRHANKAALGSFWGWVAGTGFKLAASVVFLVLFVVLGVW
ncbi:MAG TPA: DUF456 domain-containing protein [Candidatus Paceibacterota bacterium]